MQQEQKLKRVSNKVGRIKFAHQTGDKILSYTDYNYSPCFTEPVLTGTLIDQSG